MRENTDQKNTEYRHFSCGIAFITHIDQKSRLYSAGITILGILGSVSWLVEENVIRIGRNDATMDNVRLEECMCNVRLEEYREKTFTYSKITMV